MLGRLHYTLGIGRCAIADLTITASSVINVNGGICKDFLAGASLIAGQSVYLDTNNVWQKAQSDSAAHLGSGARTGITLHAAGTGQPIAVQESGVITIGATVTVGTLYVISAAAAGGIAPFTDLVSTNKIHILGIGSTAARIDMAYKQAYANGYTGLAVP